MRQYRAINSRILRSPGGPRLLGYLEILLKSVRVVRALSERPRIYTSPSGAGAGVGGCYWAREL